MGYRGNFQRPGIRPKFDWEQRDRQMKAKKLLYERVKKAREESEKLENETEKK